MAAINADPEVARLLNRLPASEPTGFVELARNHWEEHGFGWFAVEGREGDLRGQLIGFLGVAYPRSCPRSPRPELGWRLASRAWGRGLATEAARAACQHTLPSSGCLS